MQPERPLCIVPYAISQLHPLLHLILQPTSSPLALVICPQKCALTLCAFACAVTLCWNSISSLLYLGNFYSSFRAQSECPLLWEAIPASEER